MLPPPAWASKMQSEIVTSATKVEFITSSKGLEGSDTFDEFFRGNERIKSRIAYEQTQIKCT